MLNHRLEPRSLFNVPDVVAGVIETRRIFALTKREFEVPRGWAALVVGAEGEQRSLPPGARISSINVSELFLVATEPIPFSFRESRLISVDGFEVEANAALSVSVLAEPADLRGFRASVNGQSHLITRSHVERYLQPHVRASVRQFVARRPANELVAGMPPDEVTQAMREAITPACFSAGLSLSGMITVSFTSSTFRAVQEHEAQARLEEQRTRVRAELDALRQRVRDQHLDRLSDCLQQLRSRMDGIPSVEMASLLRTFSETERGELYAGLAAMARATARTRWLAVVAGTEVLLYEPTGSDEPVHRVSISRPEMGAPRSVGAAVDGQGREFLWVGSTHGLWVIDIARGSALRHYRFPHSRTLRGGFNRAACLPGSVILTHSELGLVRFQLHDPADCRKLLPRTCDGATTIRHANVETGYLYFSRDHEVLRVPLDALEDTRVERYSPCPATVTALHVDEHDILVGDAAGNIARLANEPSGDPETIIRGIGRPVESIQVLSNFGVRRLVYADTTSAAHARVLGDTFECRYEAGGQTLRWVAANHDLLAGVNDARDRLFIWDHTEPLRPRKVIPVARNCGHTIQDLCLIQEPCPSESSKPV